MNGELDRLPNGAAAAAIVAAGIGVSCFGLLVVLSEALPAIGGALNLITAVGPLSGKVAIALIVWLVSWVIMHWRWHEREVKIGIANWTAIVLIAVGFALTFPPIFELFAR